MFFGHAVCWVLGETLEAARLGSLAVEVDYEPLPSLVTVHEAIEAESFQGGQPHMERGDIEAGFDGRRPRLQRRVRVRRAGALLPRDALLDRAGRRERPDLRPEQHPAPHRDAGHRRPRPRARQQRRHRPVPADGWRLRGQGDATPRVCRDRRPRCDPHRPSGAAAADPHPGHDHVGQAARVPRRSGGSPSTTTGSCRRSTPPSRPTAAGASTCPSRCWPGRCATSTTPTGSPTSG